MNCMSCESNISNEALKSILWKMRFVANDVTKKNILLFILTKSKLRVWALEQL